MKIRQSVWWLVGVSALVALGACGSGGSSSGDAQVRLVNATRSHAKIDMIANVSGSSTVGTTRQISNVATGTVSGYVALGANTYSMQLTDAGAQDTLALSAPSLTKDQSYTLVAYESAGAVKTFWLSENDSTPASGSAQLRVYDVATDAGALDVYVTAPTVDLATLSTPSFTLGASGSVQVSSPLSFTPGTYRVRVTSSGNKSDLRLDIPSITIANQAFETLILTSSVGGGLIDGATLVEKGSYASYVNTNARVRMVSGVASGRLTASVGAVSVEAGTLSPSIGSYVTVPAGTSSWSVAINGVASAVPPITLAAGSDNTLLVSGTTAASTVTPLVDDNHAPSSTTNANLRLVNGLPASTAGLSLTVDFALVASNITPGGASTYKPVTANTNLRLQVDSALSSSPVSLQTGLNILGGGVYSIFVLGDGAAPVVSVRRDR